MTDSISYKVFLRQDSTIKEVRMFYMNRYKNDLASFRSKIEKLFSVKDYTITWKDAEGDDITISRDEEYNCANDVLAGGVDVRKFYITIPSKNQNAQSTRKKTDDTEKVKHNAICDGCNGNIIGLRYKCVQCPDFDLCSECESKGIHANHVMICMSKPFPTRFHYHTGKPVRNNRVPVPYRCCLETDDIVKKVFMTIPWLNHNITPFLNNFFKTVQEDQKPDAETGNTSQAQQTEDKPKEETAHTDENAAKKFPGEGRKLIEKERKDDEELGSDTASVASQVDEWTVINNTAEVNQASSNSSKVDETNTKEFPSTSTAPSAPEESSTKKVYPELPKETISHQDPLIREAVEAMMRMGFSNEGGLLTCLLEHQKGNINNVIEILSASKI